eukprot:scaffold20028_cov106-Isochrysis_galbana.AAC.7
MNPAIISVSCPPKPPTAAVKGGNVAAYSRCSAAGSSLERRVPWTREPKSALANSGPASSLVPPVRGVSAAWRWPAIGLEPFVRERRATLT